MRVALVCIAKNEDKYLQEWVEYHVKLGFNDVFVYQNDWRSDYEHPKLTKIALDGLGQQMVAYSSWLKQYKSNFDWVAFFDVDEFLVLKKHKTIQEFVSDYPNANGIGINWYFFGDNGLSEISDNEYSVIKRFTKRGSNMDIHVKTILNCKVNCAMGVHNPPSVTIVSPNGVEINGPFNKTPTDDIAQINHYFCKTFSEFLEKCDRGRADIRQKRDPNLEYEPQNLNEVEDLHAYNFMYGKEN